MAFAIPSQSIPGAGDPNSMRNPYLDEIDAAANDAHAKLSPGAQEALRRAGAPVPQAAPTSAPQRITSPGPTPRPISMGDQQPVNETMPSGQPAIMSPAKPIPLSPQGQAQAGELARITAPPPSDPSLIHTHANTGASGIEQIHSPWARVPLQILQAVGAGFAPGLTSAIPGTDLHHQALIGGRENALKQQEALRQGEEQAGTAAATQGHLGAQAHQAEATAETLEAEGKRAPKGNFIAVGNGLYDAENHEWVREPSDKSDEKLMEIDENIGKSLGVKPTQDGRFMIPASAAGALLRPRSETGPKTLVEKWIADNPEGKAEDLQAFLAKQPKSAQFSAEDQAIIRTVGGDPTVPITEQPPAVLAKYLAKKKEAPPERPPQALMIGPDGQAINVRPGMTVPAGAMTPGGMSTENETPAQVRSRQNQAEVIKTAGDQLIASIERNRGKLGNLGSYWSKFTNGSPIADPETAALMAQLSSFAALQPALHGFRGAQALSEFEKVIGGVPKNPDALEAAIKAIQGTAGIVASSGKGGEGPAPSAGNVRIQQNSKGEFRYSTDGGKTWQAGKPPQ